MIRALDHPLVRFVPPGPVEGGGHAWNPLCDVDAGPGGLLDADAVEGVDGASVHGAVLIIPQFGGPETFWPALGASLNLPPGMA